MSNIPPPSDDDLNDALKDLASSFPSARTDRDPIGPRHLTKSQAGALSVLSALYQLQGQSARGGIVPRNKPLLVGSSGVGKTALIRRLCDLESSDLLVINAGAWIPCGSSTQPHTLHTIRNFVVSRKRACVMLDELDKACPRHHTFEQSWSLSVFTELISLLDADLKLTTAGWSRKDIDHLQRSVFVVGAGTWQRLTGKEGGDASQSTVSLAEYEIPEEIFYRFNPALIRLQPPERDDYSQAVRRVREALKLPVLDSAELKGLVDSAVDSRIGIRWVEQYLTQLLIQWPNRRMSVTSEPEKQSDCITFSSREVEQKFAHLNAELEAAQEPVARLSAELLCCIEAPPLLPKKTKPLPVEEMKSMVVQIRRMREGLQFNTCVSFSALRGTEKILLESSAKIIEKLSHWLANYPLVLSHWNLLARSVEVEVRIRRIHTLATSIPLLSLNDPS